MPAERKPSAKVAEVLATNPRIGRLAEFLVNLQAYTMKDRDDVEVPIEGISAVVTYIPSDQEARSWEREVRDSLTQLCGGDEELGYDVRDHYLYKFFDKRELWPTETDEIP